MRCCAIISLFLFLITKVEGQNLVPNPSFELYTTCPGNGGGEIGNAVPWYSPTQGTTDYFNQCNSSVCGVPNNFRGNQNAKTGTAYSGIAISVIVTSNPNIREYIQVQLTDSLISNKEYCISFYVSLADTATCGITEIGAYISETAIGSSNSSFLPYLPQVVSANDYFITDKNDWILISGRYIASGGEKYITIGNFNSDANTDTVYLGGGIGVFFSYYYIDEVSVTEVVPLPADAGEDKTNCKGDSVLLGTTPNPLYTYTWRPATGLSDTAIAQPMASPEKTTTYYLTVTDTVACNIEGRDSVVITVENCKPPVIPNVFTPNNDGNNDVFKIEANGSTEINVEIYNRWGTKIYEYIGTEGFWDGRTTAGAEAPPGVYYYLITLKDINEEVSYEKGVVQLLR